VLQYSVEIVTAVTIILIVAILTVYLSILKKNGWIGKISNYRCPNPQCKKIFHSPLKVKDYSNRKETYLACPECGYDLGSSNNEKALRETIIEKPEVETQDSPAALIETTVSMTNKGSKEPETIEIPPQTFEPNRDKSPQKINLKASKEITIESKSELENNDSSSMLIKTKAFSTNKESDEPKALETAPRNAKSKESKSSQKINHEKIDDTKKDRPTVCNNYFGYLWSLSNGAITPDECYCCPRLIDCYKETKD
jgi:hypothetical protein